MCTSIDMHNYAVLKGALYIRLRDIRQTKDVNLGNWTIWINESIYDPCITIRYRSKEYIVTAASAINNVSPLGFFPHTSKEII